MAGMTKAARRQRLNGIIRRLRSRFQSPGSGPRPRRTKGDHRVVTPHQATSGQSALRAMKVAGVPSSGLTKMMSLGSRLGVSTGQEHHRLLQQARERMHSPALEEQEIAGRECRLG